VVLLDPSIYIPPTFPQLFLVEDEQFQDWDVKIDGKKYALRKPKADQGFLIDIISSYLIPDLARLVLQYLPLKEELIGSLRGFVTPTSVAVSKRSGNIYVLSPGAQIIVIHDSKGKVIGEIETRYLLKYPQRIAISPTTNHIYVTDASRIYVFDDERSFLRAWGSRGVNAGEFKDPQGMTISDDGEVYVADRKNNRIQVFDEKGTFLRQWGSDALKYPSDVAVSGDEVYVVDTGNHQVKVYSRDGKLLRKWGETGWEEEQFMGPLGIAISPTSGEVYVTDEETSSFQVFAKDGKFLRREIRYDASFNHLEGIAIDSKGEIYIANRGNNNVLIFRVSLGLVKEEEEED
jgi:tripartite motif-containing protein 71